MCVQSDILATPPQAPENNLSHVTKVLTQDNPGYWPKLQQIHSFYLFFSFSKQISFSEDKGKLWKKLRNIQKQCCVSSNPFIRSDRISVHRRNPLSVC